MRSAKGSIRSRGPGRWWVAKPGPPDPATGKRTEIGRPVRGSRADAAMALALLLGEGLPDATTWQQFYDSVVEPTFANLSPRTASDYRRLWEKELRPRIGCEEVSSLDWRRANEVLTDIPAPSTQRYAGRFLKKMCNMAIRDRSHLLVVNPVDRAIEYAPLKKRTKRLVDASEVPAFLSSVRGCPHEPLVLCELGGGLRPEEARALLWEDVSPYALGGRVYAAVSVDKALTEVSGSPLFKDTKNGSSARTAVIGDPFAPRLLELAEERSGPLLPSGADDGTPESIYMTPSRCAHSWERWRKAAGVPDVSEKDMRSSYATMMGEAGAPDSVVAGNMGHSDGSTKARHYQRVTMRAKCMAADLLAECLEGFF